MHLHRALKDHLKRLNLHTWGGKSSRTGADLVNVYGEQHFFDVFNDFYKNYRGGRFHDQFIGEVRESITGGYLKNVIVP